MINRELILPRLLPHLDESLVWLDTYWRVERMDESHLHALLANATLIISEIVTLVKSTGR